MLVNKHSRILWLIPALLVLITMVVAPFIPVPSASALSTAQKKTCFDELDARTVTITTGTSGASIQNTSLSQSEISACVQAEVCTQTTVSSSAGYGGGSIQYSYNCIPPSDQVAVDKAAADAQSCYDLLNGKTVVYIPPGNAPSINGKAIDANKLGGCVSATSTQPYCSATTVEGSQNRAATYSCTDPSIYTERASANAIALSKEAAPIIALYCGSATSLVNIISTANSAYSACVASVKSGLEACRDTQRYLGSELTKVRDSPENIATCLLGKVDRRPPLAPIDKNALIAAVASGQTAGDQYQTSVANNVARAECETRASEGYTWDEAADGSGQCIPPNTTATDNCPLPAEASMRWLGCSLFFTLQGTATALGNQIDNYLYADPGTMFGTSAQNAATTFRNIGMVIIVVAGLFMVISQALGFEFLDAYTIRKLMPRLGIALIGMALSWPLLKLAVTVTNDLGGLVSSVLLGIANGVNPTGTSSADGGTGLGVALTSLVGVSTVAISLGIAGFLSLVGTVVLALLIGLLVLSVRQLVIFMAILIAPLAIAAYVIPGGQKLWSFWKNTLITTLFMYPLIMAFIAAGAAMSYIMPKTTIELQVLAIIVYFAPFFMLPFAFKMAGGLMGTIFSIANDKNRGLFDKGKKKREGIREERRGRAENNSLWDPNSRLQKALGANKWASVMTDPYGNLAHAGRNIPGLRKKGSSIEASINSQRTQQTGKLFEELNNMFGNNDKAYRLLSGAHSGFGDYKKEGTTAYKLAQAGLYGKRITGLNDLQAAAKILGESEDGSERLAGNAIHNASGRLATLNRDPEMLRADVTAAGMMGLAAHGFASGDDLAYTGNLLKQSGMSAGAAQSMVVQAQVMGARGRPDLKAGYGIVYDATADNGKGREKGAFVNGMTAPGNQNRAKELIMSLSSGDLAGAKSGAFKALTTPIKEIIATHTDAGRAVQEQVFSWAGQYSQASADVKAEALQFIRDNKLEDKFNEYNRTFDPNKAGAGAPPAAEPPAAGGQAGGK